MAAITQTMRNVLIDHMDGKAIRYRICKDDTPSQRHAHWLKRRAIESLRKLGHLQRAEQRSGYTVITDKGRALLSWLLADYAEALLRAGSIDMTVQGMMESKLLPARLWNRTAPVPGEPRPESLEMGLISR